MDAIVEAAMTKWPNVPACTGWLALDRRGRFRMRDEACQAAGLAGEPIRHAALTAFIARNYGADDTGRWFFQNGPQRVFVDLTYTPLVVQLGDNESLTLTDQCGAEFVPDACWCDSDGNVLFSGLRAGAKHDGRPHGAPGQDSRPEPTIALLHDHDLDRLLNACPEIADAAEQALHRLTQDEDAGTPEKAVATIPWGSEDDPARRLPVHGTVAARLGDRFRFVARPRLDE